MHRYALRDDQWERIKDLLPGRIDTVGVTAKDNRLFVEKPSCIDIERVFLGEICLKDLEIFVWFILVLVDGIKKESGKKSFLF